MAFTYGGVVMGVKVEARFVEDEEEGDINSEVWYYVDEENDSEKRLNLETDFCCTADGAHDIAEVVKEEEIKILYQEPGFEEGEVDQVVLGINLADSYKEELYDITDLIKKITPEIISQRSKEISDILEKKGLPNKPVGIYLAGNLDI